MAETMKLQVVKCPSCSNVLTSFSAFKSTAKCSRCGAIIKNPTVTTREEQLPERMIPFTTSEEDFEKALVKALVKQDYVPKNIFEVINTDDVFRAYLPMYLYEGTFQSSWSCESAYFDKELKVRDNWTDNGQTVSTKKVKKWQPQNGTAAGNFAFLCLANEGSQDLPDELREFTCQFPYDVMMSQIFDGELLSDADEKLITIPRNADATLVWQKHGKDLVDETAQKAALMQIGNQEIRNFRASSSFNLTTKGLYLLVPFWFVYYTYNNQQYNFMMDGTGQHTSYNYPIDEEEVNFVKGKEKIKKIVKWLWPLAFVVAYLAGFVGGLVYFVLWFIAKLIVNKMMDNQIQARFNESRSIRQTAAEKL